MNGPNWFVGFPTLGFENLDLGPMPDRVRQFDPEDLHVTLAFFGSCDGAAARRAFEACADFERVPIQISLGPVEMLGNPRSPSAVAALIEEGRPTLEEAIAKWRAPLLEAAGAPEDLRPPKAHVTLARIQRSASPVQRRNATAWARQLKLTASCPIDRIALYTWSDDRRSRLFRIVESLDLKCT